MDERTDPVEEYRHMAPGLAPDESGACRCLFTVVSREPCKLCGGYTLDRLREVLAERKGVASC